jgi:hypothetical protein
MRTGAQLLHGALYHALGSLDETIHAQSMQVRAPWGSIDFADIRRKLEPLRAAMKWAGAPSSSL